MTAKELLKPRFEVIETYPKSSYDLGMILTESVTDHYTLERDGKEFTTSMPGIEKYPHIFRKLNWWEKRTKEQMPKKLKSLCSKDHDDFDIEKEEVFEILEWDMDRKLGRLSLDNWEVCDLEIFTPEYGYIPVD